MIHPFLWSLTGPRAATIVGVLAVLALLGGLWAGLRHRGQRRLIFAVASAVIVVIACAVAFIWRPYEGEVPWYVYVTGAIFLLTIAAVVVDKGVRLRASSAVLCAAVAFAGAANVGFQMYPTVRSLHPVPAAERMSLAQFKSSTLPPKIGERTVGALVSFHLAGVSSGFNGRDAVAFIPPSYWTQPRKALPVIVLMAGNPGEPMNWFANGEAGEIADTYQAAHGGVSPLVVSVDATGSYAGNPICVDGPELKVQTYIANDVPSQIKATFRVDPNTQHWTIGGLSYGGTCALQVITNAPDVYGSFLNFSGQEEPTLGKHDETVAAFFGGDEAAFNAVDPAHLLQRAIDNKDPRYQHIAGHFISGKHDPEAVAALKHLNDLAQRAGMDTQYSEVPGGHDFEAWRTALTNTFEWAATRGGL